MFSIHHLKRPNINLCRNAAIPVSVLVFVVDYCNFFLYWLILVCTLHPFQMIVEVRKEKLSVGKKNCERMFAPQLLNFQRFLRRCCLSSKTQACRSLCNNSPHATAELRSADLLPPPLAAALADGLWFCVLSVRRQSLLGLLPERFVPMIWSEPCILPHISGKFPYNWVAPAASSR